MADRYMNTLLTPPVLKAEHRYYGKTYPTFEDAPETDALRESEKAFIGSRDSFYIATVTENDWPYLQHRGGPVGFLKVLSDHEIGFADYRGNRQMISVGNVSVNDRVSLFLMDYPKRQRLKILGHSKVISASDRPDLVAKLAPPGGHGSPVERVFLIKVLSYDWNCPKFITPRYSEEQIQTIIQPLENRIKELESTLAKNYQEGIPSGESAS